MKINENYLKHFCLMGFGLRLYQLYSPRSGGLVDYEDDEDDEDYKPPPRKQPEASEEDEGELLRLKRKSPLIEREQEASKKPRLGKNSKRENVFAVLCSTLSHAVLAGR